MSGPPIIASKPPPQQERRRESALPRTLTQNRVIFDLPRIPLGQAVERLLGTEFAGQPERMAAFREALLSPGGMTTLELVPGVAFASGRAQGLREPLIFLAISPEGLEVPVTREPPRLLFFQISPTDRPAEHLENLAAVAEAVRDPDRVQGLCACRTSDDLFSWFRVQQEAETRHLRMQQDGSALHLPFHVPAADRDTIRDSAML